MRADYAVGSKPITKAVIAAIPDQQLVDGAATPEPTVTYEATVLTKDRDYTLAYQNNEGMAFCSGGEVGIYRLYNGGLKHGQHHFTASKSEVDWLAANHGWSDEGIKLFCISVPAKQES